MIGKTCKSSRLKEKSKRNKNKKNMIQTDSKQLLNKTLNSIDKSMNKLKSISSSLNYKSNKKYKNSINTQKSKLVLKQNNSSFFCEINDDNKTNHFLAKRNAKQNNQQITQKFKDDYYTRYHSKINNSGIVCNMEYHLVLKQLYEAKLANQKLKIEQQQLKKRVFLKQVQKQHLQKQLQKVKFCQSTTKQNIYQPFNKTLQDNSYNNKHKMQVKSVSKYQNQQNNYKSMQLKPHSYYASIADSSVLKQKYMNSQIKESITGYLTTDNDRPNTPLKSIQTNQQFEQMMISPQFRSICQPNKKVQQLQAYLDELVQMSRGERNRIKKKQIWRQMKLIAQEIKDLK